MNSDGPTTDACVGEEMEVVETKTEEVKNEDVSKHKRELPFRLTVDDLLLLVDFFYLPHQHGKRAVQILKEFKWLKANSIKSDELSDTESAKKVWTEFYLCANAATKISECTGESNANARVGCSKVD